MTMTKEYIISIIKDDWKYNKNIKLVCLRIVEWLYDRVNNYTAYTNYVLFTDYSEISYKDIKDAVGNSVSDEYLLRSIQYLSGDRVKVLQEKFKIHFDTCYLYGISPSYIAQAREKGVVKNPVTNQNVTYDDSMVILYFSPLIV